MSYTFDISMTFLSCVKIWGKINQKKNELFQIQKRKKEIESLKCICTFISDNCASQRRHEGVTKAKRRQIMQKRKKTREGVEYSFVLVVATPPKHFRASMFFHWLFLTSVAECLTLKKGIKYFYYEKYSSIFSLPMVDGFFCMIVDSGA